MTEDNGAPDTRKRRIRNRIIIIGLILVGVIALAVALIGPPQAPAGATQLTATVSRGDVSLTIDASGQVVDEYTYSVAPETPAVLSAIAGTPTGASAAAAGFTTSSIDVSVGDSVTDGQRLATVRNGNDESFDVDSPREGRVRSITTAPDAAATQVATLGVGNVLVAVQVSEYDIANVAVDQTVTVVLGNAGDEGFEGTVSKIAQTSTNTTGVEQYQVLITSDDLPEDARIGMTATASIIVDSVSDVLTVPATALTEVGDMTFVDVVDAEGNSEPTPVTVGLVGNSSVEILSGVEEGDEVVTGADGDVPAVEGVGGPPGFGG
ncbi:efflux RND transporter periplasmic adaptor subunit [Microbacterium sp. HJ5]